MEFPKDIKEPDWPAMVVELCQGIDELAAVALSHPGLAPEQLVELEYWAEDSRNTAMTTLLAYRRELLARELLADA